MAAEVVIPEGPAGAGGCDGQVVHHALNPLGRRLHRLTAISAGEGPVATTAVVAIPGRKTKKVGAPFLATEATELLILGIALRRGRA